jgi:hypothetical protein
MRFAAFISYRHVEPDKRWATWLHGKLETYRVPKGITPPQVGNRRIGRVFRDDEELAANSDLGASIKEALTQSEYLVVVCSPEAAKSKYVNQEIREFASLGRQDKILALLIKGEPDDAFPPALKELDREPLAADIRSGTAKSRKLAALRILAAILNCTFDQLRQRERLRIRKRIELTALVAGTTILLVLAIRFGLYRLSLDNRSVGTYGLVVRHGLNFMQPLMGSRQSYVEVSDTLYEVSPKGQAPFASGASVFFPAYSEHGLFQWLNGYYLEELKQAFSKTAPASEFFVEQIDVGNQPSLTELFNAIRAGAPAAYEVVVAHQLTGESFRKELESAFANANPKIKAGSLNTLYALYGEDSRTRDLTNQVVGLCDAEAVKVLTALSFEPDQDSMTKCATSLIAEKRWQEAASLVVRFQLPSSVYLPWLNSGLNSSTPEEFLAAADIVAGMNINDLRSINSLRNRLSDSNERIRDGAALTLWSAGEDGDVVRQNIRQLVTAKNKQGPAANYYVALLRSKLTDGEAVRGLEPQLSGWELGISQKDGSFRVRMRLTSSTSSRPTARLMYASLK